MSDQNTVYSALGGKHVLITAASVEQTGFLPGALYEFVAFGGSAICRWDTTAAVMGDAGFTFAVPEGQAIRVRNPTGNTLLNVIEASADSSDNAALTISLVLGN